MSFLKRSQALRLPHFQEGRFWIVNLDQIEEGEVQEACNLLNDRASTRSRRFHSSEDQNRSIIAHALLRFHLGECLKLDPQIIEFCYNSFGKPYLDGYPLHFSLSHTQSFALIGIHSQKEIGVDIERDRPGLVESVETILKSNKFTHSIYPETSALSIWCATEAYLKAIGTGFKEAELPSLESISSLSNETEIFEATGLKIHVFDGFVLGHKIAICIR